MVAPIMGNRLEPRHDWEDLEIELLLECVYQCYGFDFRAYEPTLLRSKLLGFLRGHGIATFSGLQDKIMHDAGMGEVFLREMNARKGKLFGNPAHIQQLRDITVPWLRSHPSPKIWIAECMTPEDVCTLAILLDEEGLYERTQLFATGSNESLLRQAATCGIAQQQLAVAADDYRKSGGRNTLLEYFQVAADRAILLPRLRANITWAQFNLQSDASFNEFHLIMCHHVLHDYSKPLRCRVLHLFHESLSMFGQLSMDAAREAEAPPFSNCFRSLAPDNSLYKRVT